MAQDILEIGAGIDRRIAGEGVALRRMRAEDVGPLHETYFSRQDLTEFLSRSHLQTVEATERHLKMYYDAPQPERQGWIVCTPADEPIGILLCFFPDNHTCEIHYGISGHLHGLGYATAAVSAFIQAVRANGQIEKVQTAVPVAHLASRRVLEKSGFKPAPSSSSPTGKGPTAIGETVVSKGHQMERLGLPSDCLLFIRGISDWVSSRRYGGTAILPFNLLR